MIRFYPGRVTLAALVALGATPGLGFHRPVAATDALDLVLSDAPAPHTTGSSPNWVGYAANAGGYSSVSATWQQPAVDCSQGDGSVVFWVGLDGWGSNAVEQLGTEAQCNSGTAAYRAWWETYPVNAVTPYSDTVQPGDVVKATVTYLSGHNYDLTLTDQTQGWSEDTPATASANATNASAEIVAETPSNGTDSYTNLPDFLTAQFSQASINGQPLGSAAPVGITMVRSGHTLASVTPLTGNNDFAVDWQAGS